MESAHCGHCCALLGRRLSNSGLLPADAAGRRSPRAPAPPLAPPALTMPRSCGGGDAPDGHNALGDPIAFRRGAGASTTGRERGSDLPGKRRRNRRFRAPRTPCTTRRAMPPDAPWRHLHFAHVRVLGGADSFEDPSHERPPMASMLVPKSALCEARLFNAPALGRVRRARLVHTRRFLCITEPRVTDPPS